MGEGLFKTVQTSSVSHDDEIADIVGRYGELDIRMVSALAGDRAMNAREQSVLQRLKDERGEALYSDMLYILTHKAFPAKQAKHLWREISNHRKSLKARLGRDLGIAVTAHDYLTNVSGLMRGVSFIEESKLNSLTNVATRDGLTGLFDQTTFKLKLKEELERQIRYGGPLALVMFDIDHFKKINDTYGHTEGDTILRQVADIVREQVRTMDTSARYGGEEFAIILPEVDLSAAFVFAERLRQAIEQRFKELDMTVTISAGVSASDGAGADIGCKELIEAADSRLYQAKRSGRNRVCRGDNASKVA